MDSNRMTEPEPDAGESPQEEKAEAKGGEYVEFAVPKGFVPPEMGEGEGDQFDLVCSFKVNGSKLCMTKLGDHDMPVKKEKEKVPDYKGLGQSIVSGTDQMMQSNQTGY
jgi:hypothetical protein